MDEIYTTILGAIGSDKEVNKILGILTGEKIDDELYQSVIAHLFETAGTLTRGQLHSGIRSRYQQLVDSKKIAPHEYGAALAAYAEHVSKGEVQVDAKDMTQPDQQYNAVMTASNDYIRKQLQIKSWQTHNYETKKAK
ncbi:MAG: hypothetical protein KKF44_05490 [Nanoarchaeota archaeon]|nr:hypothetical protein [Nanoarchaeota archaeon]